MLERFLQELGESGHLDSEGCFTVDLRKGSSKLQKHLLKGPSDYLLVAVRGAVAGGAESVAIRLHYRESRIDLSLESERADQLALELLKATDFRDRGAHLLRLAMGGAFSQEASEVEVQSPSWLLRADGESLRGRAEPGKKDLLSVVFRWRFGGFLSLRNRTAQEHKDLSDRCALSVVPIDLDGRRLTGRKARLPLPSKVWSDLPMDFVLAEGFLRYGEDKLTLKVGKTPCGALYSGPSLVRRDSDWMVDHGGTLVRAVEENFDAYFCLTSVNPKGCLYIVKDGVLLEPLSSDEWLRGSVLAVRVESVETDAGELKPRDSEELQAVKDWTREVSRMMVKLLSAETGALDRIGPKMWKRALLFGGIGFVNGLPGGPVCASVIGGVGALLGVVFTGQTTGKDRRAIENLLSRYEADQSQESISAPVHRQAIDEKARLVDISSPPDDE